METAVGISLFTCAGMLTSILFKPSVNVKKHNVSIYWMVVLLGAAALILSGCISLKEVFEGLSADTAVNPIKILVLFFSMSVLSVFLDEVGFFRYMACLTLSRANASQKKLFVCLFVIVSVLTVFTSNDIIILTFTPFICYFAKNAGIDPTPYLFCELVAANTWSMMFVIGNPTNIYLATANGITFMDYFMVMALPTLAAGLVAFGVLYLIFRKKLALPLKPNKAEEKIADKRLLGIGLLHLILCTGMLVISAYIEMEMWLITLAFACSLFVFDLSYRGLSHTRGNELKCCLKRVPWEMLPFIISMFVIVLTLDKYGVTGKISTLLECSHPEFSYGTASFLTANMINNIPMSVLFCPVIGNASQAVVTPAVYASIVGSNLGALLTPVGALAAIMWSNILKKNHVAFKFTSYIRNGVIVSIPALLAALAVLSLSL